MDKNIQDEYIWTKSRKILTLAETGIRGLSSFGYNNQTTAKHPQPNHIHVNSIELTYIMNGEYHLSVNEQEIIGSGGDILITFPNEPHGTGIAPRGINEIYWMHINMSEIDNFMGLTPPWNEILYNSLLTINGHMFHVGFSQTSILNDAMDYLSKPDPLSILTGQNLIIKFLLYCSRHSRLSSSTISKSISPDILKSVTFINENLNQSINIEQLSRISNLSASRFKTKFKEEAGTTPNMYIIQQKITLAKKMLQSGMSVTDTAFALDYSSSNYFSSVFKKMTSLSPSDYQKGFHNK